MDCLLKLGINTSKFNKRVGQTGDFIKRQYVFN